MWIVRLALRRPYTFVVMSILILVLGVVSIVRTPIDIFPNIDIPVVVINWQYTGLTPKEMSDRVIVNCERALTLTVSNIEHMESQSLFGIGIIKVFFHPNTDLATATAQVTAITQTIVRALPRGINPPGVITYNASSVPILQLGLSGAGLAEQQLADMGRNFVRVRLVTVAGVAVPTPYGGKLRTVMVDLDTTALQAKGLSPADVVNAVDSQNLILPSGTAKMGPFEYFLETNASAPTVQDLNDLPVKTVNGSTIYVHDIGYVRDGFTPQTNIVRVNGSRSVLMSVLKLGDASTLDVIDGVRKILPRVQATLPIHIDFHTLSDQSIFVKASIIGVVREGAIAACLTGLMIVVFLGSWRSTIIIFVSIPLSVLTSLTLLSALGQTINIMTLGGVALAVGILVDDATVEVENINRNLDQGKEIIQAILDGASQIAVAALVSTVAICIVFVPMFFLTGVPKYLFVPLAEAVVFAMLASYLLSRTLVPTMARYLLLEQTEEERREQIERSRNPLVRMQARFETGFEHFREHYYCLLAAVMRRRVVFVGCFLGFCVLSFALLPIIGQDFFPSVDSGEFKLHMRAPTGTRIEETAAICDNVEKDIRRVIPPSELTTIIDNIGIPYSNLNLAYSTSAPIGPADADIQVELTSKHRKTNMYVRELRARLRHDFPGVIFYELPVDIVTQILNFGLPAPVDIQVMGRNIYANHEFASQLMNRLKFVPGVTDLRIQQPFDSPRFYVKVDRTKASQVGFTESNVAQNLLIALSGSFQTQPQFWLDPQTGVSYSITTQMPQYRLQSLQDLANIPVASVSTNAQPQILGALASFMRGAEVAEVSDYDIEPVIDIYGGVDGRDLGGVAREITSIIEQSKKELPVGSSIAVRGQIQTMNASFIGLLIGLCFSIALVYLLIVVNFQSWLDPFIILTALPAALAGILWFLFVTGTTISEPALTGAIMCIGVATSNSILLISFAKERLRAGKTPIDAALDAGFTRFRPVLITALAMVIGMLPMSLGLGEGGEQNAPLGRAVAGGLLFATVATLFFVPVVFSILHGWGEKDPTAGR
jgi:multidrug efflux pump subunit AcrB